MSNATDRIPKELYVCVGNMLRSELGSSWVNVFERKFKISQNIQQAYPKNKPLPTHVQYNTGQPMGALSS